METLQQAVLTALATYGTGLLSSPHQFVGAVSDLADTESAEMAVLYRCCDAHLLEPYQQAAASQDASALERAASLAEARLTGDYAIDATAARSVASQIALGICDHLGIPAPSGLTSMLRPAPAAPLRPNRPQSPSAHTLGDSQPLPAISGPPPLSRQSSRSQTSRSTTTGWTQASTPSPVPAAAPSIPAAPPQVMAAQPIQAQPRGRGGLVAVAIGAALALAAVALFVLLPSLRGGDSNTGELRYQVVTSLDIPGLDAEGSRIPVHVTGTTTQGSTLDEHTYIDYAGEGLELPSGDYAVTLECTPVSKTGTVYVYQGAAITLSIPSGNPAGTIYEVGSGATLTLPEKPIEQVDQDLLDLIIQFVRDDPSLSEERIESLTATVQQVYDDYQASVGG